MNTLRWTSKDLEAMPDDGKRYEIIDGELYMSRATHVNHQAVCDQLLWLLKNWNKRSGLGRVISVPGLIFDDDDDVIPDIVWLNKATFDMAIQADGKLHSAPELVIEVLSPGSTNAQRDREAKRKLYSRRGVSEYWIADWRTRQIEVYKRSSDTYALELAYTLNENDKLKSELLPKFSCQLQEVFEDVVLL